VSVEIKREIHNEEEEGKRKEEKKDGGRSAVFLKV
jgi:hypothetical protein